MIFSPESVFSDETPAYRTPELIKPDSDVRIRLRTALNGADGAYICLSTDTEVEMKVEEDTKAGRFQYYCADVHVEDATIDYYFRIVIGQQQVYYFRSGYSYQKNGICFSLIPDFYTPDWAKGAVFYQIFVDRFCNGDKSNDVVDNEYYYVGSYTRHIENWSSYPTTLDVGNFYGGDLEGVWKKLDYLQKLGVEVIYLNPIFVSPSNHKYDTEDYDYIDPHYGRIKNDGGNTLVNGDRDNRHAEKYIKRVADIENLEASNEFFARLTAEIHRRGMKVILDGVFNHCGSFNKWLDREGIYEGAEGFQPGAYGTKESPYNSYFKFKNAEEKDWPANKSYEGWWGVDTLPKLNYEDSEKLFNYIMHIAEKWVSPPYNCDGWRLDVAADLGHSVEFNHHFWKEFRKHVRAANPNALILAEHYGDPESWLKGDEWDSVMNYDAFMEPITWFLTGVEKHSDEFKGNMLNNERVFIDTMNYNMAKFSSQSLYVAMNELSNHDHSRFLTRTNRQAGRIASKGAKAAEYGINLATMRSAVIMQFTWVGAPTVYYGDEAGVCGWTDPDNRRTYPWGCENKSLIKFHEEMIKIHKAYDVLKRGSFKIIYGVRGIVAYGRFNLEDQFVVMINNNDYEQQVEIPVWQIGIRDNGVLVRMIYSDREGFGVDMKIYEINEGLLKISLKPESAVVLKNLPNELFKREF